MARLCLRALTLLAAAIPARTWSLILNMQELLLLVMVVPLGHLLFAEYVKLFNWNNIARKIFPSGVPVLGDIYEQASKKSNGSWKEGNIAFVKTHETGSTPVAAILYRYAVRHNLKLAQVGERSEVDLEWLADQVHQGKFQRVDIMHYEISSMGHFNRPWADARKRYRGIMRDPDKINFLTVIREPRAHFISYYYHFVEPTTKLSIEDYVMDRRSGNSNPMHNPLSSEFGITTFHGIEQFVVDEVSTFKLMLLTDRFDEGLMVLRRLLGWSMIDMTYMMLNETTMGSSGWDDKPVVGRPSFDDLSEQVQSKIDALTDLDQVLYTAAQVEYDKRLRPMSDVIDADLEEFQKLQKVVSDYLNANDSSKANAMYRAEDVYSGAPPMNLF